MSAVNLAEAKAKLSELVDRAEAGETIDILRRGKLAARIVPAGQAGFKKPVDADMLRRLLEGQKQQPEDAGTFMRRMRDEARY